MMWLYEQRTGGHVLKKLSKTFNFFFTPPNCVVKCKVIGNWKTYQSKSSKWTRNSSPVQCFWTGKSCGLGGEMCKKSY